MKTKDLLKEWNNYLTKQKLNEDMEEMSTDGHFGADYRNISYVKNTCETLLDGAKIAYDKNTFDYAVNTDKSHDDKEAYTAYIDLMEKLADKRKELKDPARYEIYYNNLIKDPAVKKLIELGEKNMGADIITYDAKFVLDIEGRLFIKMNNNNLLEITEDFEMHEGKPG